MREPWAQALIFYSAGVKISGFLSKFAKMLPAVMPEI